MLDDAAPANLTLHLVWWTGGHAERNLSAISRCALERFRAFNRDATVWLWTDNPKLQFDGVTTKPLSKQELFQGSPLAGWSPLDGFLQPEDASLRERHNSSSMRERCFSDQNYANAFRLAVLYKHGGLYMDMDVITTAQFPMPAKNLTAAVTCETEDETEGGGVACSKYNNEVLYFAAEDPCLHSIMTNFRSLFDNCRWGNNGPDCITRVLMSSSWNSSCAHVHRFPQKSFAPVSYTVIESMTTQLPEALDETGAPHDADGTYAVHTYNKVCGDECHATFLRAYCPDMQPDDPELRARARSDRFHVGTSLEETIEEAAAELERSRLRLRPAHGRAKRKPPKNALVNDALVLGMIT